MPKKSKQIHIRATEEEVKLIQEAARIQEMPVSMLIRRAMTQLGRRILAENRDGQ